MASIPLTASDHRADLTSCSDIALVELARNNDEAAIRALVRRHNQRLFRVARAIVHDDAEAEDVEASYVKAFTNLTTFRGDSEPPADPHRRQRGVRAAEAPAHRVEERGGSGRRSRPSGALD